MKKIDVNSWNRKKQYEWFKNFSNPSYEVDMRMDVTKLVNHSKENKQSFFINMLFIVLKGLNSVEELKIRLVNNNPVIFDDINPAYAVMTNIGTYENVRHKNYHNYKKFYKVVNEHIELAKKQEKIKEEDYNPKNNWNEYYITCLPWIDFTHFSHPIPDSKESLSVPRICWGKYIKNNDKYELTLNITVNHMFVDGYPLSKVFNNIQVLLNDIENILK